MIPSFSTGGVLTAPPGALITTGVIYVLKNSDNGKAYVGQTVQSFSRRLTEHKREAKKGSPHFIHRAIRKYGIERFELITVEGVPVELLDEWEVFFIRELRTIQPFGYNVTPGGDKGVGLYWKGRRKSEETKAKISQALMGHSFSGETLEKMRLRKVGVPLKAEHKEKIRHSMTGRVFSEEWRFRLSEAAKRRYERERIE